MDWKRSPWLPPAILALLVVLFVNPALKPDYVLADRELDLLHGRHFAQSGEYLRQGTIPLWSSREFFGSPLLANIQLGICYPPNWLGMILPARQAITFLVVLHLFLCAGFTYGFYRSLGGGKEGGVTAGAMFAFSGFVVSKTVELMSISTLAWLPAILWCIEESFKRKDRRLVLLGGLLFGLQCLAGHTQYAYYSALMIACYGFFHVLRTPFSRAVAGEAILAVAVTGLVGTLIFAVQLLPTYELSILAQRSKLSFEEAAFGPGNVLSVKELVLMVLPHFYHTGEQASWVPLFLGFLWPMLMITGLVFGQRKTAIFSGAVALVTLLLAAGGNLPFFRLFYESPLPGFSMFHDPIRMAFLSSLAISILCGLGVDALVTSLNSEEMKVARVFLCLNVPAWLLIVLLSVTLPEDANSRAFRLFDIFELVGALIVGSGAIVVSMKSKRFRQPALRILIGMQVISFFWPNVQLLPKVNRKEFEEIQMWEQELADKLPKDGPPYRIADLNADPLQHTRWLRYGIDSVSGFSSLIPRGVLAYSAGPNGSIESTRQCAYTEFLVSWPLLRASNCRYVVVPESMHLMVNWIDRELRKSTNSRLVWFEAIPLAGDSPWRLYEFTSPLDRLEVAFDSVLTTGSRKEALSALAETAFDSERLVLVTKLEKQKLSETAAISGKPEFRPNYVRAEVEEGPGWLLFSDQVLPGWRSFVDGQSTRIVPGQYLFKAVPFGVGRHEIEFIYEPRAFRIGVFVTMMIMTIAMGITVGGRVCRVCRFAQSRIPN